MRDEQVLEHYGGSTTRACEFLHVRIGDRERPQLALEVSGDRQTISHPEFFVVTEDARERHHEVALEGDCVLTIRDIQNAVRIVEEGEERIDVVDKRTTANPAENLRNARLSQCLSIGAATRAQVAVESRNHLVEHDARQQVASAHALLPADPVGQNEALAVAELVDQVGTDVVLRKVAQNDVRADIGLTRVESLEASPLPVLVGVQVNQRAQVGRGSFLEQPLCRRSALQSVDHKDLIHQQELAAAFLLHICTTHTQVDVRDTTSCEGFFQDVDLAVRQDLTLVARRDDTGERQGVDNAADCEPLFTVNCDDVQGSVDHFDHELTIFL